MREKHCLTVLLDSLSVLDIDFPFSGIAKA